MSSDLHDTAAKENGVDGSRPATAEAAHYLASQQPAPGGLPHTKTESSISTSAALDFTEEDIDEITGTDDLADSISPNTLRMWLMTFVITTVIAGVDALFQLRYPTVSISNIVAILVAWPMGKAWHRLVPDISFPVGFGRQIHLNPGPFTRKEHGCVLMFINVCTATQLTNTLIVEQIHYFGVHINLGLVIFVNLIIYILAWSWMGLTEDILVKPSSVAWPGVLGQIALIDVVSKQGRTDAAQLEDDSAEKPQAVRPKAGNTTRMSRMAMFGVVFGGSFVWYWISGFVFTSLADIGAFISWIRPNNATLSQVFGVQTGLGLFPLSLDWSQISTLSNPLLVPFWASSCLFLSFSVWTWIVLPAIYYTNTWQSAHFPIMTSSLYTAKGKSYDFSEVVTSNWNLDEAKYKAYSPLMLPGAFLLSSALGVASFVAMILQFALNWRRDFWVPISNRNAQSDRHNVMIRRYPGVSKWFYVAALVLGIVLGIIFCEVWKEKIQITAGPFIVTLLICASFFIPLALVEARANFEMTVNNFLELVAAFWLPGQPIACMYFTVFGYGTLQHSLHQAQSAKIGHYLSVPPRLTSVLLLVAGIWSSLVNGSVTYWALQNTPKICTAAASNNFVCRKAKVSFNQHVAWGLLGNKLFAADGRYSTIYIFIVPAAIICLVVFFAQRKYPRSLWSLVNPVLLIASATKIPGVTGINFSSWYFVAFIFGFYIHKKHTFWWRKYNMIVAVALDAGVAVAVIIIFFALTYTNKATGFKWWGNTVQDSGCDAEGCSHLSIASLVKPTGW